MKTNISVVIIILLIGVFIFAYQGLSFATREKILDLAPIQITANKISATSPTHKDALRPDNQRPKKPTGLVILKITDNKKDNNKK